MSSIRLKSFLSSGSNVNGTGPNGSGVNGSGINR
jgi:hypothetical protein